MSTRETKKKILVLASTFPRWKNDTTPPFVFELEKRLTNFFHITVLAPHHSGAKKREVMEGVVVKRFQYFWPEQLQKLCYNGGILPNLKQNKLLYLQAITLIFFELVAVYKIIKKEKTSLIHAHWIIPQGIVAFIIRLLTHTPYIVTVHGGDIYGLQHPLIHTLRKIILQNAQAITVVSDVIKKEILIRYDSRLTIDVIPMGVDPELFNSTKADVNIKKTYNITGPFLLFVGRLAEKKGVEYLLRALPSVLKVHPHAKLLIIGEGPLTSHLQKITSTLRISNNVIFCGAVPHHELAKYYASADIFIGPSIQTKDGDTEGFGLTFVEAGLSKCVLIGSNIGGITDIIQDGSTGFLVKAKDSKDISQTILKILKNMSLMKKIVTNARKVISKKFNWKVIQEKYKNVYLSQ